LTIQKSAASMLWGNTAYCVKLNGEDLLLWWNKTESVQENVRSITILLVS